jgi:hypothetical protein
MSLILELEVGPWPATDFTIGEETRSVERVASDVFKEGKNWEVLESEMTRRTHSTKLHAMTSVETRPAQAKN